MLCGGRSLVPCGWESIRPSPELQLWLETATLLWVHFTGVGEGEGVRAKVLYLRQLIMSLRWNGEETLSIAVVYTRGFCGGGSFLGTSVHKYGVAWSLSVCVSIYTTRSS